MFAYTLDHSPVRNYTIVFCLGTQRAYGWCALRLCAAQSLSHFFVLFAISSRGKVAAATYMRMVYSWFHSCFTRSRTTIYLEYLYFGFACRWSRLFAIVDERRIYRIVRSHTHPSPCSKYARRIGVAISIWLLNNNIKKKSNVEQYTQQTSYKVSARPPQIVRSRIHAGRSMQKDMAHKSMGWSMDIILVKFFLFCWSYVYRCFVGLCCDRIETYLLICWYLILCNQHKLNKKNAYRV